MKSLYKAYGTNKKLENEGVVLDFGDTKFRVRRAGGSNRRYQSVFSAKTRPVSRQIQAGTMPKERQTQLLIEIYFEAVVIGWEGVTDEDGNELAYTKENFTKVMTDLPDLWETIVAECDNMKNFQDEEISEDAENLGN